jgi:hypothetical protein
MKHCSYLNSFYTRSWQGELYLPPVRGGEIIYNLENVKQQVLKSFLSLPYGR